MKIEMNKTEKKRFTILDLKDGETFTFPDRNDNSVFIRVGSNGALSYGNYGHQSERWFVSLF